MALRPYQQEAVDSIFQKWNEFKRLLLVLPTGCGKTIVFSNITQRLVQGGERVLILAHREELLAQAAVKLKAACGVDSALEKAESSSLSYPWLKCVCGSVQSLCREKRLSLFKPDHFGTVIIDEAHHALSDSYRRIIDHFSGAKLLGVTATPDRGDKKNLSAVFEALAYEYSLKSAIESKYLCPIVADMIPLQIDLNQVSVKAGDYNEAELGDALEPYLEQIANEMVTHCSGRKTVVFLPLIATSKRLQELLIERGVRCAEVNGDSPDRTEILNDFDAGKYDVICNSMLLTEGWDCPSVDCVVVLRPTKVRSLYCQMVGRGTRISPGKENLLLLDFLWMSERHSLCRPASLVARNEEIYERMQKKLEESGQQYDVLELEEEAENSAKEERENALAKQLAQQKWRKQNRINPVEWALTNRIESVYDYECEFNWEEKPPTEKQIELLERMNFDTSAVLNRGHASKILDCCFNTDKRPASENQVKCLARSGFQNVRSWSFKNASVIISILAKNNWRLPRDFENPYYFTPSEEKIEQLKLKYA